MALQGCGGQDSNLRTDKEWDLNPPPLTKLGDPRASLGRCRPVLKPPMFGRQAETSNPVAAMMAMTSSVDNASVVSTEPFSDSNVIVASSTSGLACRARFTRPEQPPQVMPEMVRW